MYIYKPIPKRRGKVTIIIGKKGVEEVATNTWAMCHMCNVLDIFPYIKEEGQSDYNCWKEKRCGGI